MASFQDVDRCAGRTLRNIEGQEVFITASIGIGVYPDDGMDRETLLKNADAAMYHAKGAGGNSYQFYDKSINAAAFERLSLENSPRKALEHNDFGTGYSSLNYLKRFPIDVLKIDRSFICDIPASTDDMAIASTIIAMARSLKLSTVAEGVETDQQLGFLRQHGCATAQGHLFSKPVPAEEFEMLLREQSAGRKMLDGSK